MNIEQLKQEIINSPEFQALLDKAIKEKQKDNILTIEEVYEKVKPMWFLTSGGMLEEYPCDFEDTNGNYYDQLPSENHAKQLLAISKLMVVSEYVNEGWKPNWNNDEWKWVLEGFEGIINIDSYTCIQFSGCVFKSEEAAELAIKIVGEETVKHYLGIFN